MILYAPTFRNDKKTDIYKWDYKEVIKAFKMRYHGNWKFILRLHPNISFESNEFHYSEDIINGSDYDDMQELIMAVDAVITDYSGVMMQAAIARKQVLLLIPDKDMYLSERGLCLDIGEMPFSIATDVNGLCKHIKEDDKTAYRDCLEKYLEKFAFFDNGSASERVAKNITQFVRET